MHGLGRLLLDVQSTGLRGSGRGHGKSSTGSNRSHCNRQRRTGHLVLELIIEAQLRTACTWVRPLEEKVRSPIFTGITGTSYTVGGLTNGTTYFFEVAAVNSGGTSGISNEASATPISGPPSAPAGLTASPGNGLVALSWSGSTGATSYNMYRGTSSGGERPIATGITATAFSSTGLSNGTPYYFRVAAVNSGGTSGYSNEASATPTSALPNGYSYFATYDPVAMSPAIMTL